MNDTIHGWPTADTAPPAPPADVAVLLDFNPADPAVAVTATDTTVEVWTTRIPSPATVAAWEAAAGRTATAVICNAETMAVLAAARRSATAGSGGSETLFAAIGADHGPLTTGGSPWPTLVSVTITAGRPAMAHTWAGRTVALSGGTYPQDRLAALAADLGCTPSGRSSFAVSPQVRCEARGDSSRLRIAFRPASFPGVDVVGLPAGVDRLTRGGPGIVAVGSGASSGRTSLAYALAAATAGRTGAPVGAVGAPGAWPSVPEADWATYRGGAGAAVDAAADAGAGVICIDDIPSEQPHDPVWDAAGRAAAAGATVVVTSRHARIDTLARTCWDSPARAYLAGAVVRYLARTPAGAVAVDDTLVLTPELRTWLATHPGQDPTSGRDVCGQDAGHGYDTSLGLAASSGLLTAEQAAPLVRDPARYAAAGGTHTSAAPRPADGDWDWDTRTGA